MGNLITSLHLKTALMVHYRFKKNYVCAEECPNVCNADIIVDTGKTMIEIETKISKHDLYSGEKRKPEKHYNMKYVSVFVLKKHFIPNQYYIAVPTELVEVALKWVEENNNLYGVLECKTDYLQKDYCGQKTLEDSIKVIKKAGIIHNKLIPERAKYLISKRLSSSVSNYMISSLYEYNKRIKNENN